MNIVTYINEEIFSIFNPLRHQIMVINDYTD